MSDHMAARLVPEQQAAVDRLLDGDCVRLTGRAGTGKSFTTREAIARLRAQGKMVLVCGSTGVAAQQLIGGSTLHRQLGLGPRTRPADITPERLGRERAELLAEADVLVIDEISMVRADVFDVVDVVLRTARAQACGHRYWSIPFGGVQLLLVGDSLQLPPVLSKEDKEGFWSAGYRDVWYDCSNVWQDHPGLFRDCALQQVHRVDGHSAGAAELISVLNETRHGELSEQGVALLNSRHDPTMDPETAAKNGWLVVTGKRKAAADINHRRLVELNRPITALLAVLDDDELTAKDLETQGMVMVLQLAVGARVMLTRNHRDGLYVNGSFGEVRSVSPDMVTVRLDSGDVVEVGRIGVEIPGLFKVVDARGTVHWERSIRWARQFPLKLAWAITVHKAQGQTVDKCYVHSPGSLWDGGQLYVAISRVSSLSGLVLGESIDRESLRTAVDRVRLDMAGEIAAARGVDPVLDRGPTADALAATSPGTGVAVLSVTGEPAVDGYPAKVTELAVLAWRDGELVGDFDTLVDPQAPVWSGPGRVPMAMLGAAPALEEAMNAVLAQVRGMLLVVEGSELLLSAWGARCRGRSIRSLGYFTAAGASHGDRSRTRERAGGVYAQWTSGKLTLDPRSSVAAEEGTVVPGELDTAALLPSSWTDRSWDPRLPVSGTPSDGALALVSGAMREEAGFGAEALAGLLAIERRARATMGWTAEVASHYTDLATAAGVRFDEPVGAPVRGDVGALFRGARVRADQMGIDRVLAAGAGTVVAARPGEVAVSQVDAVVRTSLMERTKAVRDARRLGVPVVMLSELRSWARDVDDRAAPVLG